MARVYPTPNRGSMAVMCDALPWPYECVDIWSEECLRMASDPTTPAMTLTALAVWAFVEGKTVPDWVEDSECAVHIMAEKLPHPVLAAVARNPATPVSLTERIIQWGEWAGRRVVIGHVIENPATPIHLFADPGGSIAHSIKMYHATAI